MNWNDKQKVRIAILDLNHGHENQGMRCIREIIKMWGEENSFEVMTKEFEVRLKNEVPGSNFDVYISSGGPGSPFTRGPTRRGPTRRG